nr:alpha-amylase [Sporichthyaceae bacterium]
YEYKAALNDSWTENYGANATFDGTNIAFTLGSTTTVKFYYDHDTHWITSNRNARIVTAAGSFQSELGCPGDWQPDCLRSWLQDPDGDATSTFVTTAIPAGDYETKATIGESWDENYGQGGVPGGPNIAFNVPAAGSTTTFTFVSSSNTLTVTSVAPEPGDDHRSPGTIEWDGLRHDSRNLLYRTPSGAVRAGTPVRIRLRAFHDDVTGVSLRVYDANLNAQRFQVMRLEAEDIGCYEASLAAERCDLWGTTIDEDEATSLWYRFLITDDADADYYADDTAALDGGPGAPTDDAVDRSWALTVYEPDFARPAWASKAIVYQIFPDRFRNGDPTNDPTTGQVRYDDPVVARAWGTMPEGYCRGYEGPEGDACADEPRGRDYQGGDLQGVIDRLDYLQSLGVNTLYFNPIFAAKSNHRYDTADYSAIDPNLGTNALFRELAAKAKAKGMRIVLDGVFNHMSSDSPRFDRYGHYPQMGACESTSSPWRAWFFFFTPAPGGPTPCAGPSGPNTMYYSGWFNFDSIPVLDKALQAVQRYFLTNPRSVTKYWLRQGAAGWRMDVMGDASFPDGYWETFRDVVKAEDPQALIISETWQKDSTLLGMIRGDRADSTMNYRLRDAVLGLLAPEPFDSKGFPDSGSELTVRQFAARMASIYEDYAPAADQSLMNLLDSHDTERILWTLTPGDENRAAKELDTANLAQGKRRLRLASLIQFTVPGMPTVYYGDEVGVTGDDDPDDRRAYPWADTGGQRDLSLLKHYRTLAALRTANPALTSGRFETLLADNPNGTVAYAMTRTDQAAIVAINRSATTRTVVIPAGIVTPDGTVYHRAYGVYNQTSGGDVTVSGGTMQVRLGPLSGLVLVTDDGIDLQPPPAPTGLTVSDTGDQSVSLSWNASVGASAYKIYRSPVASGGFVLIGSTTLTTYEDNSPDLVNGMAYHYAVEAIDGRELRSTFSDEVVGIPHLEIDWANLQWPPSIAHTISTTTRTPEVYGQVYIPGATSDPGATPSLRAQLGWGPDGSEPAAAAGWRWVEATFNTDAGNNDEFKASLLPDQMGTFDYAYRYTTTNGVEWLYADLDGTGNGYQTDQAGSLVVSSSGDTTAPPVPANLVVVAASPDGVELDWDDVTDATLEGYQVRRSATAGGPYTTIATVDASEYTDTDVVENGTYFYVVRALDTSFNRSAYSNEVEATAELRLVSVTFNVTVPASTDATGRGVYIAGTLQRLEPPLAEWNPGAVALSRADATHWTITVTGRENTQLSYKYTLGDWEHVEKDASCAEIGDRMLTLAYGPGGTQTVNDTVENWRNIAPCGN